MAGETSGPGPSEQEIRMVALERKFDELLSFVQLIAKRNTDDENQRKEDDKDTSEAEPEGHSNTNATPPRPPTPPKPEGKDSQLDSKIDSLEEKIRLIQGLNSFGNTDFSSMSWFPNMTVPPKFKAPEFEKYQWERRPHDPSANPNGTHSLKKISHWKELADTFLGSIRVQLPNSSGSVRPSKDGERRATRPSGNMPKVGERIEDALKTKKIVDMTALMALAEQAAKKAPTKEEGRGCANDREKQWETEASPPNFHHAIGTTKAYSDPGSDSGSSPGPSTPDAGKAELYPILIEKNLISPTIPRPYNGAPRKDFNQNLTCDFHFGEVGHAIGNCNHLRHRVQDLIDHGILKFEGLPNITTNPLPNHPEGGVNMVEIEEGNEERILWRRLFYTLEKKRHITPLEAPPGPSTGDACEYHSGARGHSLECCEEFKKKITNLMENGLGGERRNTIGKEPSTRGSCHLGLRHRNSRYFTRMADPEVHLQKYGEKMALHLENELLMISVFPESLSKQAAAWFYQLRNLTGWDDLARVFLERYPLQSPFDSGIFGFKGKMKSPTSSLTREEKKKRKSSHCHQPKSQTTLPLPKKEKSHSRHHRQAIITTTVAEEEYAGPMVEGLSIHTIAGEEDSTTTPPTRHCQQGEEAKTWTCVPLLQRVSSSNEITRKTSNDPHANEGEEPREVKIGTRCAAEQKEALIALLREFHEIFAWSYQDMPGLDTDIVVHKIPLKPECKPVKQALRRMKPEVILKIKEEVEKQLKAGFLSTVTYSDWVANIVPVPKKDGKVRMCVDYRDLNRASPKDNFPLPHIDTLVDNTATNVVFSFMDGFSGYNQIKMAEEDKSKTAFITHWGTFVYDVMPFGLKNAGATYQRAMVTLFHDMIHHEIEVYVDDMIAKSRTAQDHLTDLRKLFQRLKKYQLRLNPNKCAFGVTSGKLLGFIVSGRGIEIDPAKTAREAFDKIKEYLLNPPILVPPTPGRPLILYLTVQEASMGCMLGQQDETGKKEQAIYYLSKKFTEPETRYLLVEKTCCALAWASKKLRQYMLYYTTWLVSRMDPIKYIFEKPALTGKIARWQVLLSEFDILFVARKAIKGQAIADYLADYPSEQLELMDSEFPDEDHASSVLQAALEFGAYELEVFGDSLLIVSQTNGEWQARDPKLIPYQRYISRLVPKFKYVTFTYTPRAHNHFADALATLASLIKLVEGDDVRPLRIETRDIPAYCVCIEECMNVEAEIDDKPWYYDIKRFIQDREYPSRATENEKKYIRRMAFQFFLSGEILYKRTHDATLLRCVDAEEANRLIPRDARGIEWEPMPTDPSWPGRS
uniref:Reverse transcriptase domain-containing protein n=1 Tax=Fagus sylvatica TaxID=28930 RepID=A0A2N9HNG3_FAGSY